MRPLMLGALLIAVPAIAPADDGDDTLKYYLSKTELAVAAEIVSDPEGMADEIGVINYACKVRALEVFKGERVKGQVFFVNVVRFEMVEEDRLPYLTKGAKCILFLKSVGPTRTRAWKTVDVWFGIQSYGPWMARSLNRLGKPEAPEDVRAAGVARANQFWAAVAQADTEAMAKCYAPQVLLKKGSELLKPQWGLPGADRNKDLLLQREQLIGGYRRLVEQVGRRKWGRLFSEIGAEKITFTFAAQADEHSGVRKGDLIMQVATGPGDDALLFFLRRDDQGRWLVVAEATDY